jgi:hypothetical protein
MPATEQTEASREEAPPERGPFVGGSEARYGFATIRLSVGTAMPAGSLDWK